MPGKQAKFLSSSDVHDLLTYASATRHPRRNRLIVLLSVKAGLRAAEIAQLTWDMVLTASGDVGAVLELRDAIAKNGSGRLIPLHPELANALTQLLEVAEPVGPVIVSERGRGMTPCSIVLWFKKAFANIGLQGCSSHSGRRTLGQIAVDRIAKTIAVYDNFCHANDPYEEHDFGAFEVDGHTARGALYSKWRIQNVPLTTAARCFKLKTPGELQRPILPKRSGSKSLGGRRANESPRSRTAFR
jgi:integrase-like protein/uncharacterized protein DUF3768